MKPLSVLVVTPVFDVTLWPTARELTGEKIHPDSLCMGSGGFAVQRMLGYLANWQCDERTSKFHIIT